MEGIIFLGSDIHGEANELATKLIRKLIPYCKKYKLLSIQDVGKFCQDKNVFVIPNISKIRMIRLLVIGVLLPIYLFFLRGKYNKIAMFWTASSIYHSFLFFYLKLLNYKLFFTVISGYDKNYSALKFCDKIICQSKRMEKFLRNKFSSKKITLIYPAVDLDIFKPSKKKNVLVIPSCPHDVSEFKTRNLDKIIKLIREFKIKSIIITRTREVANYLRKQKIPNLKIIDKTLSNQELAEILSGAKLIPLIYKESPDMPLSGIESLSCGCSVICSNKMGLADIVKKNKCGIVSDTLKLKDIQKIFSNSSYNRNARKIAEKYFDLKVMIKKYENLLS